MIKSSSFNAPNPTDSQDGIRSVSKDGIGRCTHKMDSQEQRVGGHSGLAGWVGADWSDELIGLELMWREPIGGGG